MDTGLWNERYGAADRLWSGNPHSQLPEIVAGMQPGSALDIACGEGADALWLAEQGWNVTAVDSAAWPSSVLAGPHPNVPSPLNSKSPTSTFGFRKQASTSSLSSTFMLNPSDGHPSIGGCNHLSAKLVDTSR
jgi:hypothetical protein